MKNIIGQKFNMLTVIELDYIKDHEYPNGTRSDIPYYKCLCECGQYTSVRRSEIGPNRTKSCGCISARREVVDISGQKVNRLTAVNRSERKGNFWNFECDCGNQTVVSAKNFKNGTVKSCGCANLDKPQCQPHDLTGKQFGRLTVLGKSSKGDRFWDCACECGNTKSVRNYNLIDGGTSSCGCFRKETAASNVLTFHKNIREEQGLPLNVNKSSNDKIARAKFIPLAREIYERDSFCCVWCSKTGKKLNAHHLETWSANPDKRFDKNNLVTLCRDCHHTVHNENWFSIPNPIMTILLQGYANIIEEYDNPKLKGYEQCLLS